MKTKKHSSLDSWMCTEHNMLRRNSNMELILTLLLQRMWSTTKECVQKQISHEKWLITSARIFYKNGSASLDCIVHKNFTSQHQIETLKFGRMKHVKLIAWNKWKICKPKQYEIIAAFTLLIVFMNASQQQISHLQISQQIWNMKTLQFLTTVHNIITTKQFSAAHWWSTTSNNDKLHNTESKLHYYKKAIHSCFY